MKNNIKKNLITLTVTISAILLVTTATYAIGTLSPTGTAGDDTQYSLKDIFDKLTDFTDNPTATSSPFAIPGSVTATFVNLSDIYNLLEFEDIDLVPENIADGVTVFGVEGDLIEGVTYPTEWSADEPSGFIDWPTASSYCDTLSENSHTDWRLPTYIELVNAYLTTNPGNSLGFMTDYYWTSTIYPGHPDTAYGVNMIDGDTYYYFKVNPNYYARCTR